MPAAHVELDPAGQFDDGFGMMAVLEQGIFQGLRAVHEQAAEQACCSWTTHWFRLLRPMKTMADKELRDGGSTSFTLVFLFNGGVAAFREAVDLG